MHEFSKKRQVNLFVFLGDIIFMLVQDTAPDRILNYVVCLYGFKAFVLSRFKV